MGVATAGAIVAGVGAIAGAEAQKSGARKAGKSAQRAYDTIMDVNLPDIEKQKLALEQLQSVGQLTPEMIESLNLDPSAMEGISTDPRLAQSQMQALEQLSQISQGGMTEADMAALEQARRSVEGAAQSRNAGILQDMQQRGQGGSGAELAAKLASNQEAADRQNAASLQTVQDAQNRALQALSSGASLAGQVRGQEFGEKSDIAKAQDIINRFNVENQQQVQTTNVGARNTAQQQNLQTAQQMANQNVALRNTQQEHNKALERQKYLDELARAQAAAGQQTNIANMQQQAGNAQAGIIAGAGSSIGGGLFDIAAANNKNNTVKKV